MNHWYHWRIGKSLESLVLQQSNFWRVIKFIQVISPSLSEHLIIPGPHSITFRVLLMCLCQAFSIKAIGDKIFHPPKAEVGHSTVCTRLIPFVLWQMLLNRDPYQNLWHYDFLAEAEETEVELFSDEEVEVLRSVLFESFWTLQFFRHPLNS